MKLLKVIPIFAAAAALILAQPLSATQSQQADTGNKSDQNGKKKKAKKAEEQNAEPAGAREKGKEAGTAAKSASQVPETAKTKTRATGSAQRAAAATASDAEIAAAKSSGKVWVNTETGVYHKGGRWYGATKQGKFMTESDAVKAGYRVSKGKEQ